MLRLAGWPLLLLLTGLWLAAVSGFAAPHASAHSVCEQSVARATIHAPHQHGGNAGPALTYDDAPDDDDQDGDDVLQACAPLFALLHHPPRAEVPARSFREFALLLREHRRPIERPPTA